MKTEKSVAVKIFQIITAVLYVLATAFIVFFTVDIVGQGQEESFGVAVALVVLIPLGFIALIFPLVSAIIGLIISIVAKVRNNGGLGAVIYFIVFTVLPVATFLLMILTINLLI